MLRLTASLALLMAAAGPLAAGQEVASIRPATIRLTLPPGIPPEAIQINYFMTGPFGGYGSVVRPERGQSGYTIVASQDGKNADRLKLIAYFPDCELETLDVQVPTAASQQLACKPIGQITLHGQIAPPSIISQQSEIEVTYLAVWDHKFFGIADGPVTTIRVATAVPDDNGDFSVSLPDLHSQAGLGDGEFHFTLREIQTGNIIALLIPTDEGSVWHDLKVQGSYPSPVHFS
jgi:hypothetical protein